MLEIIHVFRQFIRIIGNVCLYSSINLSIVYHFEVNIKSLLISVLLLIIY